MECPYCDRDLLNLIWKYWSGNRSEHFELICPECGNNVLVVARLNFDIHKHEEGST
jgi:DNA-directed RNA polymerase subunit RPC12/RpoP